MKSKRIECDQEDLINAHDCGCYVREGAMIGDAPYRVLCSLHESAPELLEALRQSLSYIEDIQLDFDLKDNGISKEIKQAIAKAEGKI